MQNINRRSILVGGLSLAAAAGLSACGGSDSKGGDGPKAGEAVPTSGTLKVWCWDPAFNIYAMKEAAKIYTAKHPDVKVDVKETPWDDIQTKLTTLAQSKKGEELPDIFLCQNMAYQKNLINYGDLFADITDSGIKFEEFPESVTNYSMVDGKHFGVPFDNGVGVTALRLDVLSQAGLKLEDFTDVSWKEFTEKGKIVKEKTGKALISGQTGATDLLMMMMGSAGASLFTEDGKANLVNNDTLKKAIEAHAELLKTGVMVEQNSWDQYIGSFVNGQVAGTVNGIWILGSVQTAKDQAGKWDITNTPKLDGVDAATNYSSNGGSSWGISAKGQTALAADFLKETFAGSTQLYDTILPGSGAVANYLPAGKSEVYKQPQPFFNNDAIYAKASEYSAKVPKVQTGVYYYEARDAAGAAMRKIIKGTPMADALAEAQKNVEFAMK